MPCDFSQGLSKENPRSDAGQSAETFLYTSEAMGPKDFCLPLYSKKVPRCPPDIGGGIYLSLKDQNDIAPIQVRFLDIIEKRN